MMSDVVSAKILKVLEALLVVRLLLLRVNSVALHQVQDVAGRGRGEHCRLRMVVGKHCRLEEKSRLIRCAYPAGQKTVREVDFTVFWPASLGLYLGQILGLTISKNVIWTSLPGLQPLGRVPAAWRISRGAAGSRNGD